MRGALALLLLAPLASADVRVVSPAGPYTQIQPAINAANDGDLVLVKPGTYVGFQVQAKALAIVGDSLALVPVIGTVSVTDLAAGQTVSLIGLNVTGLAAASASSHFGLYSNNNLGSLRCQRCTFTGASPTLVPSNGFDGVRIENSSDVSLAGCTARGGDCTEASPSPYLMTVGGCGVRCLTSTLTFFDCAIEGGWGEEAISYVSGSGGAGLQATDGTIFGSNSTIRGGQGGYGDFSPGPGYGGAGADVSGSMMRALGCTLVGGLDGDYEETGQSGPAFVGGTYDFLPGTPRTLSVAPDRLRELHSLGLTFHGAPGEQVYLLVGLETAVQWDPLRLANYLIAPPQYRTLLLGTTNASGDLIRSLPFGDLGGTTQSQVYFLQPLFSGAGGAQQLGTPVTLAVLDQAF